MLFVCINVITSKIFNLFHTVMKVIKFIIEYSILIVPDKIKLLGKLLLSINRLIQKVNTYIRITLNKIYVLNIIVAYDFINPLFLHKNKKKQNMYLLERH